MTPSSPTIGIYTTLEGHFSISTALEEILREKGYQVVTYFEREPMFDYYVPIYRFMPQVFRAPYELSKNEKATALLQDFLFHRYRKKVETFFEAHRPDYMISAYFAYNPALERVSQLTQTPFLNVLTDPRSFHPIHMSAQADMNLVFDQAGKDLAAEYSPTAKTAISGWFVRKEFYAEVEARTMRQKLHKKHRSLHKDTLTFFIASGSEGTNVVMKILPALFALSQPVQVIVACGSNKMLLRSVRAFGSFLHKTHQQSSLIALPFTKNIHEYMQASDLIIGKAGPNTLFEAVACQRPFMAISHIAGQESGNLDIIREYQLGYVEENPIRGTRLLQDIVEDPSLLNQWQKPVQQMRQTLQRSQAVLLETVSKKLPLPTGM